MSLYWEASYTLDPAQVARLVGAARDDVRFDVFDEPIVVYPEAAGATVVAPALPDVHALRQVMHAVDKVVNPDGLTELQPWREMSIVSELMAAHVDAGGLTAGVVLR